MPTDDPLLTQTEAAALRGVSPSTWRGWRSTGRWGRPPVVPPPDDPGDLTQDPRRRSPRWLRSTVLAVQPNPPGRPRTQPAKEGQP